MRALRLAGLLWLLVLLPILALSVPIITVSAEDEETNYDSRSDVEEEEYVEEDEEEEYYEEEYEEEQREAPDDEYYYENEPTSHPVQTTPFDDSVTISEQEIVTLNVLGNDRTILGWHVSPRIVEATAPSFGEITINSDNTITYSPSQIALPSGYEKSDVVQYTASADGVSSYTGTITIWIQQVNDPPVAYPANYTIKENVKSTFNLDAYDEDNDSLTFTMISGTEFGTSELDPISGRLVYTPLFEFSGKETLTFMVSDGISESEIVSVLIMVDEVGKESIVPVSDDGDESETDKTDNQGNSPGDNTQPVADAGTDFAVMPEDTVTLDGDESYDIDDDAISYNWSQTAGPEVVLIDENTANPTFDAPAVETDVELCFELTVTDGNLTDTATVTVTVLPIFVDMIPHVYPNEIELSEPEAEVPVAIFGSAALVAENINDGSLRLGPSLATILRTELGDSDGDGITDHISYYRTGDLGLEVGDKTACLTGSIETQSGKIVDFEVCKNVKVSS